MCIEAWSAVHLPFSGYIHSIQDTIASFGTTSPFFAWKILAFHAVIYTLYLTTARTDMFNCYSELEEGYIMYCN